MNRRIFFVLTLIFLFGIVPFAANAQVQEQSQQLRILVWADLDAFPGSFEENTEAEKKNTDNKDTKGTWFPYAAGSAVFAALTSILAKVGISGVESNLGTAIRTGVVLIMAWAIVFAKGKQTQLKMIDRKELSFIVLSGVATGASWLCYYYAIQNGIVSVVVPIDKMSILVSIIFSCIVFHEKLSRKATIDLLLMVCGTLTMAIWG